MKALGPVVIVLLLVVVFIYFRQSGAPDAGGLGDADKLVPTDPGGLVGKGADSVADGAKSGADKTATGIVPWIAANPLVVAAGVIAAACLAFYRRHKVMSIVIGTAALTGILVLLAT